MTYHYTIKVASKFMSDVVISAERHKKGKHTIEEFITLVDDFNSKNVNQYLIVSDIITSQLIDIIYESRLSFRDDISDIKETIRNSISDLDHLYDTFNELQKNSCDNCKKKE